MRIEVSFSKRGGCYSQVALSGVFKHTRKWIAARRVSSVGRWGEGGTRERRGDWGVITPKGWWMGGGLVVC